MNRLHIVLLWLGALTSGVPSGAFAQSQTPLPQAFATLQVDRQKLYVSDMFRLTFCVYYTGAELAKQINLSPLPDAAVLRRGDFQEYAPEQKTLQGQTYTVRRFECEASGVAPGTVNVAPAVQATVVKTVRLSFFTHQELQPIRVPLAPLALTILPLPEAGRPQDFAGAVGRFGLQVTPDTTDVAVGDLVTLAMIVAGTGNFDRVTAPLVELDANFKAYPPEPMPGADSAGRKAFRQIVIPINSNAVSIAGAQFSYFDSSAESYRTLQSPPIALRFHAEPGTPATGSFPPPSGAAAGRPHPRPGDGPALKPRPDRWQRSGSSPWYASPAVWALQAIPAIALAATLWVQRRRNRAPGREDTLPHANR